MTKLSKILRILAAAAFLTALAVNVKVTLTDPFVGMSEVAIATGTDTTTSSNSGTDNYFYNVQDVYLRSINVVKSFSAGAKINGAPVLVGQVVEILTAQIDGNITWKYNKKVDQYKILCPKTTKPQSVECLEVDWTNCPTTGCPEPGIHNR